MRVVAARFPESSQAAEALDLLQRELHPPDVAVAPLARSDEPAAADAVLAGRFPEHQVPVAVELVQRAGGEIVADIDESWTGVNSASGGKPDSAADASNAPRMYRFD